MPHDARPRLHRLLEQVYLQLGSNRLEERWIDDKHGIWGMQEPGTLTVSRNTLVPVIIHEALHAQYPTRTEASIERTAKWLYTRLSDAEAKRISETWDTKAIRIKKPATAG